MRREAARMIGTIINALAIFVGGALGLLMGRRFPKPLEETLTLVMGTVTVILGIDFALETKGILVPLGSLLLGVLVGEFLKIHDRIQVLAGRVESHLMKRPGKGGLLAKGFITTSLLYCIGPLALLGPIRDGLGDSRMLLLKSALDGISAVVFASTLGVGVAFSALSVFLFQGSIALGAKGLERFLTMEVIGEFSATGGIILVLLGLHILNIRSSRVANLLPALPLVPFVGMFMAKLGFLA